MHRYSQYDIYLALLNVLAIYYWYYRTRRKGILNRTLKIHYALPLSQGK